MTRTRSPAIYRRTHIPAAVSPLCQSSQPVGHVQACEYGGMASSVSKNEQALSAWGSGTSPADAALADGTVLKPGGNWAPAVLALLRHLEQVGFAGSPRVVGDGRASDGRMMVSFVPGESPHPHAWSGDHVGRVGELLRELHEATSTFVPGSDVAWQPTWLREVAGDDMVIGHGDAAPWNIVGLDALPEAFVDWEYAGPVDRMTELAYTTWLNAQLHDDDVAELQGLPDAHARARQVGAILDGYGLPRSRRADVVDRMIELAVHSARAEARLAGVNPESTDAVAADGYPVLWAITWRARSASWMMRHRPLLVDLRA
jgi:hypothetical protein